MSGSSQLQHVVVDGDAHQRGNAYGVQAGSKIRQSIASYRDVFEYVAGWDWEKVVDVGRAFVGPIRAFNEEYWEEICGIADGADVRWEDILAINLRTEIMFSAKARGAVQGAAASPECTAVGLRGTDDVKRVASPCVLAQNWDWLPHSRETVVSLEATRPDGSGFVTLVEAGLLAKLGMNSAGIAVATNALVTELDTGEPGVPYHVLLRAMLDSTCASDALAVLQAGHRASSANYMIADGDGDLYDVETTPGRYEGFYIDYPKAGGILGHTNHFVSGDVRCADLSLSVLPDSALRLSRCLGWGASGAGDASFEDVEEVLRDHANFPNSICRHEDLRSAPLERFVTVLSAVMIPARRELRVAIGNPCSSEYVSMKCDWPEPARRAAVSAPAG